MKLDECRYKIQHISNIRKKKEEKRRRKGIKNARNGHKDRTTKCKKKKNN